MQTYLRAERKKGISWIISGILFLLLLLLPLVFLGGCENDSGITIRTPFDDFGIYLFSNAEDYSFLEKNIDQLELQETPWISASDIEIYDFSCHMIYLRNPAAYEPTDILSSPGSRGFVTAVKGKRLYKGVFVPPTASWIPYSAYILYPDIFGGEGCLTIGYSNIWQQDDPRNSDTIRQALEKAGIYHGGLGIDLLSVVNTSEGLAYTFSITNLDSDDLYVLDPDKTGPDLFHYFTNGVYLEQDKKYYYPVRDASHYSFESGHYEMSWFTLIPSGRKIIRTTYIEKFPQLTAGTYRAVFTFPSVYNLDKSDWLVKQSRNHLTRIWLGSITVQKSLTID